MPITAPPPLREVLATRYLVPLREGGSLPAICEADDLGTYVVKFHGAGQGRKALVSEVIVAELARAAGFRVPELVTVELDPSIAGAEPDPEIQDLLRASAGSNLGVDFLPRSLGFDPAADELDPRTAAQLVWFDAFVGNVDRSWRNPNLLAWHGELWLIDHGAALTFSHNWPAAGQASARPYPHVADHVALRHAGSIDDVDAALTDRFDAEVLRRAVATVPDVWLVDEPGFEDPQELRAAYVGILTQRLAQREAWVPGLEAARGEL